MSCVSPYTFRHQSSSHAALTFSGAGEEATGGAHASEAVGAEASPGQLPASRRTSERRGYGGGPDGGREGAGPGADPSGTAQPSAAGPHRFGQEAQRRRVRTEGGHRFARSSSSASRFPLA